MCKILFVFTLITLSLLQCDSARILGMCPTPVISHQKVFRALTQELAERGHQVTVITGLPTKDPAPDNYREIDLSSIAFEMRNEFMKEVENDDNIYKLFLATIRVKFRLVDNLLKSEEVENFIKDKNERFELILVEDCAKSAIILSHIFKAPVILVSSYGGSFGSFEVVGGAVHPILYPLATRKKFQNLSTIEKISEIYNHFSLLNTFNKLESDQDIIYKNRYGPDTPKLKELYNNVQMLFLNIHSIWDSNRPVPPNVIYLGGLHSKPSKKLPMELENKLNASARGAIYVSFGSVVDPKIFSKEIVQIFINVFSRLPYDVYWKWNSTGISGLPKNIIMYDWFPQSDLLRHKNIKLFITHGGLQSTDEAIAAEVPLIGIPIYWDQFFNVDKYVQLKIGKQLDIELVTENELEDAINDVINDETYRIKIKNLHSQMNDSPLSSMDQAIFWTEYVLRHGAEHLKSPSMNISWFDYYEFNLIFIVTSSLILLIYIIFKIIYTLYFLLKKVKQD